LPLLYDNHPESIDFISACLTPSEMSGLLDKGAVFDSIIFLNGEGQELLPRVSPRDSTEDEAFFPRTQVLSMNYVDENSISILHSTLLDLRMRGFYCEGG